MIEITEYIDYFFVFLVLIFGAIITKGDLSRGKIRNVVIGAGLIAGLFGYIVAVVWIYAMRSDASLSYFFDVGVNFLISILCGYLLWHYKLWAAGDAKFFILLSFLVPLRFYENGYLPYFPSSALVINIFTPLFLLLLIKMCVDILIHPYAFLKNEISSFSEYFAKTKERAGDTINYQRRILAVFAVFLLTSFFIPLVKYQAIMILSSRLTVILIVLSAFYYLQKYARKHIERISKRRWFVVETSLFMFIYFILGFAYFRDLLLSALRMTIEIGGIFFIGFLIFRRFSNFHIKQNEVVIVQREDLNPKMVISEELMEVIKSDMIFSQTLGELYPEGISKEQTELLKVWLAKNGKEDIPVYKTFSFAPYIFAGAIITIVLKQSAVHLFLSFIR